MARAVPIPSEPTLKKYGLSRSEWTALYYKTPVINGVRCCPICERPPPNGRWATDHEHVKGWKKLPPSERKQYVRGLCCLWCNRRRLRRWMTLPVARKVVAYLHRYEVWRLRVAHVDRYASEKRRSA